MRISRRVPVGRKTVHHAGSPGIESEDPIETRLLKFDERFIAGELTVQIALNGKGCCQVVGAPYKRHAAIEGIVLCLVPHLFDSLTVKSDQEFAVVRICILREFIVTKVVERIPLIVTRSICADPRRDRFLFAVLKRLIVICSVSYELEYGSCAQFHVVNPVVFFVEVTCPAGCGLCNTWLCFSECISG